MRPGYNFQSFKGNIRITDLTSGLGYGNTGISGIKGSIAAPTLKGHIFRAAVSGTVITTTGVGNTIPSGAYLKWESKTTLK